MELTDMEREQVIQRHFAGPLAPCAQAGCGNIEDEVKES
jgi:hypothetical protein